MVNVKEQINKVKDKKSSRTHNPVHKFSSGFNKAHTHKDRMKAAKRGERKHKGGGYDY